MFSGIIEATSRVVELTSRAQSMHIKLARPAGFDDLKTGDSIAIDGVCLTLESFDDKNLAFVVGFESMRVLGWSEDFMRAHTFNVERSLRMGDRIHGHWVSGHVDSTAPVLKTEPQGESLVIYFRLPAVVLPLVWHKGSIAINGVSLTINSVEGDVISVCLIPETLRRTNLAALKAGDKVNIEPDLLARAINRAIEARELNAELAKAKENRHGL